MPKQTDLIPTQGTVLLRVYHNEVTQVKLAW